MTLSTPAQPNPPKGRSRKQGLRLLVCSVVTRASVLVLLCLLAMWTEYLNLKIGYNSPRLVELSDGPAMRRFYEASDAFFSTFGDPVEMAQKNAGMTWSIRLGGIPFTDPVAALSVLARKHSLPLGFALGLIAPIGLALLFGRVFCSYICPASLFFFAIARIRRLLSRFFLFPNITLNRGLAWGVLCGGLVAAVLWGHGLWSLVLPYFSIGQTIFHGIAFGTLSITVVSMATFCLADLVLGYQFTCRNICPTGRLLGTIGHHSLVTVRRDASACLASCTACGDICPLHAFPKKDDTRDCSLCGECLIICPGNCLSVGLKRSAAGSLHTSASSAPRGGAAT